MRPNPPFGFGQSELAPSLLFVLVLREGAIDRLVNIYKDVVHKTGVSTHMHAHTDSGLVV